MPRLLSQRSPNEPRKTPSCGRTIEHVAPHSPFQKLIDGRRATLGISGRELASILTKAGARVHQSTLYNWLHNKNGFPHPKSFKETHLKALSRALKIREVEIRKAIDQSRHLYTADELPMPPKALDAFRSYIEMLQRDPRKSVTKSWALNLAITLYRGAGGDI